ncbi:MAG: spore coat protein CotJB [Lachnospira sp.]
MMNTTNSNQYQMSRQGGCQNKSCNIRQDRKALMMNIYELGFVLVETGLYLDTHPDDVQAIEYYMDIKEQYRKYIEKYSDYYGPIDKLHMSGDNYWMWVATPMPWEVEEC